MARSLLTVLISAIAFSAAAQSPAVVAPEAARWMTPPGISGVEGAWLVGAEDRAGAYHFRVRMAAGAKMPPHTHPDERTTTVLTGVIYVGFGDVFDESRMVAVPAGALYVAPANVPHYLWAKDGPVTYQESGVGPTGTRPARR